ncbi:MAG: hypothetical protein V4615_04895 [Bacteroidota bacterium]
MAIRFAHKKTLTDAPVINLDHSVGYNQYRVTLGGNRSIELTGTDDKEMALIIVTQDATGGRTLSHAGVPIPLNIAPNENTIICFYNHFGDIIFTSSAGATSGAGQSSTQLATPTLVLTAVNDTEITADWTNVSNETGYVVELATNSSFTTGLITFNKSANVSTQDFVELTASTTYYGRVKAVGNGTTYSDSSYSTDSEATQAAGGGGTPTNLTWAERTAAVVIGYSADGVTTSAPDPLNGVAVNGPSTSTISWHTEYGRAAETLAAGEYVSFKAGPINTRQKFFALTDQTSYNNFSQNVIGLYFENDGNIYAQENGTTDIVTVITSYLTTDVIKIERRTGNEFWLVKNGVDIHNFTINPASTLYPCAMFGQQNSYFAETVKGSI